MTGWTHTIFQRILKVRRFCLTLTGETRLWYESLKPIDMDWNALQTHFRQQYSKFGSSREQYFHMWRSFRYDENEDTIDSYILKVKASGFIIKLWGTRDLRVIQKYIA